MNKQKLKEYRDLCLRNSETSIYVPCLAMANILDALLEEEPAVRKKKYKIDMTKFLTQANWSHPNFGVVAAFFSTGEWNVSEDMLIPIDNLLEEPEDKPKSE